MNQPRSIIVTIRHTEVPDPEETLQELCELGFEYDQSDKDTIFDLTQVSGRYPGELNELRRPGVSCDPDGWKEGV